LGATSGLKYNIIFATVTQKELNYSRVVKAMDNNQGQLTSDAKEDGDIHFFEFCGADSGGNKPSFEAMKRGPCVSDDQRFECMRPFTFAEITRNIWDWK